MSLVGNGAKRWGGGRQPTYCATILPSTIFSSGTLCFLTMSVSDPAQACVYAANLGSGGANNANRWLWGRPPNNAPSHTLTQLLGTLIVSFTISVSYVS